jgi:hypothetical protein
MTAYGHRTTGLSLADLERHDPGAGSGWTERRFNCPLGGECAAKRISRRHRSLVVNTETGAWICHRCGVRGLLFEFRTARHSAHGRRGALVRAFTIRPGLVAPASVPAEFWLRAFGYCAPIGESGPGAGYLKRRGIPNDVAEASDVRFANAWQDGRPAILFPLRAHDGTLVAVQARYVRGGPEDPRHDTTGPKSLGLFFTAGASNADPLAITEAPLDALALAAAGLPSLALCGKTPPAPLLVHCAFRRVLVALDADQEGDEASKQLALHVRSMARHAERLRPPYAKDWAAIVESHGVSTLAACLEEVRLRARNLA